MSVKIRPVLICTLSLLLSACSGSASAPDSAEDAKVSAEVDKMFRDYQTGSDQSPQANVSRYLTQVQRAIFAKIDQPASWQGQKCSVRLTLQRDGTVHNPAVESGDPALCAAVMSALKEAKIPPAPDEKPIRHSVMWFWTSGPESFFAFYRRGYSAPARFSELHAAAEIIASPFQHRLLPVSGSVNRVHIKQIVNTAHQRDVLTQAITHA